MLKFYFFATFQDEINKIKGDTDKTDSSKTSETEKKDDVKTEMSVMMGEKLVDIIMKGMESMMSSGN